ncbi:MAG: hypothetical protein R3C05_17045 [Pirellulaceae bacterium]
MPIGWGRAPTAWLASEDGVNWRHLTSGRTKLKGIKDADGDPSVMPGMGELPEGKVSSFPAATWKWPRHLISGRRSRRSHSVRSKTTHARTLVTHHVGPVYCGETSGRFLAAGK